MKKSNLKNQKYEIHYMYKDKNTWNMYYANSIKMSCFKKIFACYSNIHVQDFYFLLLSMQMNIMINTHVLINMTANKYR